MKEKIKKKWVKKWDHIPLRPSVFAEFRELRARNWDSDNEFVIELMRVYRIYLKSKEKHENERKQIR